MKFLPEKVRYRFGSPSRLFTFSAVLLSFFLGCSLALVWAQGDLPQDQLPIDLNDPAMRRISDKLMCQCGGCSASVLRCPHEMDCNSRAYIRQTIQRRLNAGESDDMIIAAIAKEYGPKILAEPPREGFSLLGWLMPFAALLLGGCAVGYVLWRWKAEPLTEEPASTDAVGGTAGLGAKAAAPGNELVEKYRVQIERDLGKD